MMSLEGEAVGGLQLSPRERAGLEEFEEQQRVLEGLLSDSTGKEVADGAGLPTVELLTIRRRSFSGENRDAGHLNRAAVEDGCSLRGKVFFGEVIRWKFPVGKLRAALLDRELVQGDWQNPDGASDSFPFEKDPADVLSLWQYNHPELSPQAREVMWG